MYSLCQHAVYNLSIPPAHSSSTKSKDPSTCVLPVCRQQSSIEVEAVRHVSILQGACTQQQLAVGPTIVDQHLLALPAGTHQAGHAQCHAQRCQQHFLQYEGYSTSFSVTCSTSIRPAALQFNTTASVGCRVSVGCWVLHRAPNHAEFCPTSSAQVLCTQTIHNTFL